MFEQVTYWVNHSPDHLLPPFLRYGSNKRFPLYNHFLATFRAE